MPSKHNKAENLQHKLPEVLILFQIHHLICFLSNILEKQQTEIFEKYEIIGLELSNIYV